MKKGLALLLCLAMLLLLFAGCGGGPSAPSTPDPDSKPQSGSDAATGENWWEEVDFSKPVHLTFATTAAEGTIFGRSNKKAIEMVADRSGGAIVIEQVFNGALGSEQSTFAQVMEGSLDISGLGLGTMSQYTPYLDVFQLPFLINSYEQEAKVIQSDEWKALVAKAEEDLESCTIITTSEFGIRQFATINKPIKTMADIKGLKIRSIGNPVIDEALKIVGANPVNITYTDLYSALQNHIVDGEEINATSVSMQKHYEVVNYISEIGFYPFLSMAVMSNATIESLPDGYFRLIQECFAETDQEFFDTLIYEWDDHGRQDCIANGIEFNTIEDKDEWLKAMQPLYEKKAAESPLYDAFIKKAQSLQ